MAFKRGGDSVRSWDFRNNKTLDPLSAAGVAKFNDEGADEPTIEDNEVVFRISNKDKVG
jgi:hypothetical protein